MHLRPSAFGKSFATSQTLEPIKKTGSRNLSVVVMDPSSIPESPGHSETLKEHSKPCLHHSTQPVRAFPSMSTGFPMFI